MNQTQEPGKRIVSKGAYTAAMGKIAALSSFAAIYLVMGIAAALLTLMMLYDLTGSDVSVDKGLLWHWTPMLAGTSLLLLYLGVRAMKKVSKVDPGIPLTRANTADIPAPDSLVRASQEPMQAQEAVLLRAAAEGREQQEEQLLRAAMAEGQK